MKEKKRKGEGKGERNEEEERIPSAGAMTHSLPNLRRSGNSGGENEGKKKKGGRGNKR